MEFNLLNAINGIMVVAILIPNISYAIRNRGEHTNKANIFVTIIEQIGRYGCMALMILPVFVWEFSFSPLEMVFVFITCDLLLMLAYLIFWMLYERERKLFFALALAIIPTLIFLLSGVLLKHWALVACAVVFGASHIYITYINHKN